MTDNFKQLPSHSLVLHGWDQKTQAEKLIPLFENYFARVGTIPQIGTIKGESPKQAKTLSYKTISKRILTKEIRKLHTLSLLHLVDKDDRNSEDFALCIDDDFGQQEASILNAVSSIEDAKRVALDFLRDILSYVSPYYGYSLEMPLGHFPLMYATGIFGRTEREREEATAWQDASREHLKGLLYREGKFRLVFEINVLSPPHLANKIGKTPFAQWVAEPNHGRLEQWKEDVWVWFVPREDRIRCAKILQFNGLLTAPEGFESELIG